MRKVRILEDFKHHDADQILVTKGMVVDVIRSYTCRYLIAFERNSETVHVWIPKELCELIKRKKLLKL